MKAVKFMFQYLEEILAAPLMVVMSVMVVIQVLCRFIFHLNTPWAEELLRYCFIWNIMLGAAIGIKYKAHIAVTMLVDSLPRLPRRLVETAAMAVVVFICVKFFQASWEVMTMQKAAGQIMPALGVPIYTSTLALPVGFALVALRTLERLASQWRESLGQRKGTV